VAASLISDVNIRTGLVMLVIVNFIT